MEEKKDKKKLYIYEVRGIQDYIFRTNKVKEMIGASLKIENIIIKLFIEESVKFEEKKVEAKEAAGDVYICDQANKFYTTNNQNANDKHVIKKISDDQNLVIFNDSNVDAEVIYYGGGNLLVLYKDEATAEAISKGMSMRLIKETYSLRIVYAGVDVTGDYKKNYEDLREKLADKKAVMASTEPVRSFPITMNDPVTGMPFSMEKDGNMVTYESYKKLVEYELSKKSDIKENGTADINSFGSEEGESLIAVVHIDGNKMGAFVKDQMGANKMTYDVAAQKARSVSNTIQKAFVTDALGAVEKNLSKYCKAVGLGERENDTVFRKIITAGDDITFICNARIAMNCVKGFMEALDKGDKFNACAGIYVCHTHFPFYRAYEYAEELCDSAKKPSRTTSGNYVDFLVGNGGILNDLDVIKDKEFRDVEGKYISARPYYVTKPEKQREDIYGIEELIDVLNKLKKVPRTKLKGLRESFLQGTKLFEKELERINSRLSDKDKIKLEPSKYGILFDAIDIMDLKWGEVCDETNETEN